MGWLGLHSTKHFLLTAFGLVALTGVVGIYLHLEIRGMARETRRNPRTRSAAMKPASSPIPEPALSTIKPVTPKPVPVVTSAPALSRLANSPENQPALLQETYRSATPEIRIRCLDQITPPLVEACRELALQGLQDDDETVRLSAVGVMQKGAPESLWVSAALLDRYEKEPSSWVRESAASALIAREEPRSLASLLTELWRKERDPEMRSLLVQQVSKLAAVDPEEARSLLARWRGESADPVVVETIHQISSQVSLMP